MQARAVGGGRESGMRQAMCKGGRGAERSTHLPQKVRDEPESTRPQKNLDSAISVRFSCSVTRSPALTTA